MALKYPVRLSITTSLTPRPSTASRTRSANSPGVIDDVSRSRMLIKNSRKLASKLGAVLSVSTRVKAFPEIRIQLQQVLSLLNRVARAQLLLLHGELDIGRADCFFDLFCAMSDHDDKPRGLERACNVEHMGEERPASQGMKDFRQGGTHALAHACRQNNNVHGVSFVEVFGDANIARAGGGKNPARPC